MPPYTCVAVRVITHPFDSTRHMQALLLVLDSLTDSPCSSRRSGSPRGPAAPGPRKGRPRQAPSTALPHRWCHAEPLLSLCCA